mgnify:CR=1 FL=1
MAENNKKNDLGIPATRGTFQLAGYVSGTDSERFYADTATKTGKPRRVVNFAVDFDADKKQYVEVSGMEQEFVYFTKAEVDKATGKRNTETRKVAWRDRKKPQEEGFRMIGVTCGLETQVDERGNNKNKNITFAPFDASEYLANNLKDGMPVLVRGNLTYSTYENRHYKKFEATQVSLSRRNLDFDDPSFETTNDFRQRIVFMGITPNEDKSKYVVSAKIVTFNSIEDAEFIVYDPDLAKTMRKQLKPYNCLEVCGYVNIIKNEEEADSGNWWGKKSKMDVKRAPTIIELVIDGADGDSVDTELYSEEAMDEALQKIKANRQAKADFGDNEDDDTSAAPWGKTSKIKHTDEDDEDEDW